MLYLNHILAGYCLLFFTYKQAITPLVKEDLWPPSLGFICMFREMNRTEGMLNDNGMPPSKFLLFQVSTLKGAYHFSEGAFKDEYIVF